MNENSLTCIDSVVAGELHEIIDVLVPGVARVVDVHDLGFD